MVRVTPFLPLVGATATTLLAPTATYNRQESYASLTAHPKRELLTCEQTYGANWTQCGDANSTYCYNPSAGQTCCSRDAGYCDAGAWCAPVAGYCCLDSEDAGTCAQEVGFTLPSSVSSAEGYAVVSSTTTITHYTTTTLTECGATPTTPSSISTASGTTVGGLTWSSTYPVSVTPFWVQTNGSSVASAAASALPSTVQVAAASKERWTFACMTLAMGVVGLFMASC